MFNQRLLTARNPSAELVNGKHSERFDIHGDTLMCNIDGGDYRVIIDEHIDFQDVRNLCPLTDWQSLDEIP